MNIQQIAQVAHEVNTAYCHAIGDDTAVSWDNAPEWQKESSAKEVQFTLDNPDATPASLHATWLSDKLADGWKYGPVKNADKKEHPCCIPYNELPSARRAKDKLFRAVVKSLALFIEEEYYHM